MNYFAFFLGETGFIEKCLTLLKYVGNPNSKSTPHITIRLFKNFSSKYEYLKEIKITYLNIVEPGTFNFDKKNTNYVVYLKCESEELEEIDYRPDFPYSRLHITLYEGDNLDYAKFLYSELCKMHWGVRLTFNSPQSLEVKRLGGKSNKHSNYDDIYRDLLEEKCPDEQSISQSLEDKTFVYSKKILKLLNKYLRKTNSIERVDSFLSDGTTPDYKDESKNDPDIPMQMSFLEMGNSEIVKPVQDAIFVTPPEYAIDMASCAVNELPPNSFIDFGDSSIGTGTLYLALCRKLSECESAFTIHSAVGVDIDKHMADEAHKRFKKRNLTVILGDAISSGVTLGKQRNLMLVNPPYNRHEEIPDGYKKEITKYAYDQTGIKISSNSGLYVYHMLIMDKWLAKNGIGVWLIPSVFLQTNYGLAIRRYLTNNVTLLRLHIYDESEIQFEKAMVSTTIVVFKKSLSNKDSSVKVSFGGNVDHPNQVTNIPFCEFKTSLDNWRTLIYSYLNNQSYETKCCIGFSELFDVIRGIATGANEYFVLEHEKAKEIGIPEIALKPILPKSRYINKTIIQTREDGYPDVSPCLAMIDCDLKENEIKRKYPSFYSYLLLANEKDEHGKCIKDRTLVKARNLWYKQETRIPPMFFVTYMGRGNADIPPLRFLYNKSKAVALNTYLLIYPKKWLYDILVDDEKTCVRLLNCLNDERSSDLFLRSRVYSGRLYKLEPGELRKTHLYDLPDKILKAYKKSISLGFE